MSSKSDHSSGDSDAEPIWLSIVREHVNGLRFGVVQIVVHEGRVTQVDATNRTRIDPEAGMKPAAAAPSRKLSAYRTRGGAHPESNPSTDA